SYVRLASSTNTGSRASSMVGTMVVVPLTALDFFSLAGMTINRLARRRSIVVRFCEAHRRSKGGPTEWAQPTWSRIQHDHATFDRVAPLGFGHHVTPFDLMGRVG